VPASPVQKGAGGQDRKIIRSLIQDKATDRTERPDETSACQRRGRCKRSVAGLSLMAAQPGIHVEMLGIRNSTGAVACALFEAPEGFPTES
jgi:hypothetical protein